MTAPASPSRFKGPRRRKPKSLRGSLARVWLIRLGVALALGLVIGAGIGVTGVNMLEPGQPAGADSLQMVLDSITRGTTPIPAPREGAAAPSPQASAPDSASGSRRSSGAPASTWVPT